MADAVVRPHLPLMSRDSDPEGRVAVKIVENPFLHRTLGAAGPAVEVTGNGEFPLMPLVIPFIGQDVTGINVPSVRVFRLDRKAGQFRPVWSSGANQTLRYFWANIGRPGIYLPIGLPADVLVRQSLRSFDVERLLSDGWGSEKERRAMLLRAFAILFDAPARDVNELRGYLTRLQLQTGASMTSLAPYELRIGEGAHPLPFPLPHDVTIAELRRQVERLEIPPEGLPEEELFRVPESYRDDAPPWTPSVEFRHWNGIEHPDVAGLPVWRKAHLNPRRVLPWLFPKNWWMYQHGRQHAGAATGGSNITSSTAGRLYQQSAVAVDGPVLTKPTIADGKIYVGSGNTGGKTGTLYEIDLATGAIERTFETSKSTGLPFFPWGGIGGSPTVVGERIYISTVFGNIYCIDRATFDQVWMTSLVAPSQQQNQPVRNRHFDSWSGPLVVNGRVYVSGGEGEAPLTYGMVFCLDAATGAVIWLFCTNKFVSPMRRGHENRPNVIPRSAAVSDPLPEWATAAGFTLHDDPPGSGASAWSSCAYDHDLDRIYVGTGNSERRQDKVTFPPLPNQRYGSGLLSLDGATGELRGFFQPSRHDSYWPGEGAEVPPACPHGETDVDAPCAPTLYTRSNGQRVVSFGSKNGSFFILDADTFAVVARRQLLPKSGGTGLPGEVGTPIHAVVPIPTGKPPSCENKWGVFSSPAVDSTLGRLFVGLGGYAGIAAPLLTPFMRALDWNDLRDAWVTSIGPEDVLRYETTSPPMYLSGEAGLGAPAVVNDVVFIATSNGMQTPKTGFYAFDAKTGICLWSASEHSLGGMFTMGPAIYGDHVVLAAGKTVYIYRLAGR